MQTFDIHRHIGSTVDEQQVMLDYLQCKSSAQLLNETVPQNILQNKSVPNEKNITVWDTNANDWRSFRYDRIIEVTELDV